MIDCSKEISKFHNEAVTLGKDTQNEMRNRRNINRDRLKSGLEKNKNPKPDQFIMQGSYAMKTMVQHPDNDYDIDDGVVFIKDELRGSQDADMSALDARQMVCEALKDERFAKQPDCLPKCVRVYYNEGYHIDVPIYRKEKDQDHTCYELAGVDWKQSDPEGITSWFDECLKRRNMFGDNDNQLRRMVRYLKKFSNSRPSWNMPSGFILTVLADEIFLTPNKRDDETLYNLFYGIKNRLDYNLQVNHPVLAGEKITKTDKDAKMVELHEKLKWAVEVLADLNDTSCTKKAALKAWAKVFNTEFFDSLIDEDNNLRASIIVPGTTPTAPVDKKGGGQYAK